MGQLNESRLNGRISNYLERVGLERECKTFKEASSKVGNTGPHIARLDNRSDVSSYTTSRCFQHFHFH